MGGRTEEGSFRDRSLILHWDGSVWTVVPSPDVGILYDVAATAPRLAPAGLA